MQNHHPPSTQTTSPHELRVFTCASGIASIEELVEISLAIKTIAPTLLLFNGHSVVEQRALAGEDPVTELHGIELSPSHDAVALCAPATVTTTDASSPQHIDTSVIHVLQRSGSSATVLNGEGSIRWFGPTNEPQQGRVPDACRRLLQLPTSPPTAAMTEFVVCAWLEVLLSQALVNPTLEWDDIVALHPAGYSAGTPTTPSSLAEATRALGTALNWERFRRVIATVGGFPFGPNATVLAEWMDAGMFSRWAMELLPSRTEALELLDSVLGPATFDRLWATLSLCDESARIDGQ